MSWYNKTKLKKPYKIFMKCPDSIKPLGIVNVPQTDDETETKQAKAIAYKKFLNTISDYRNYCVLMASLDEAEWQRRLEAEDAKQELEQKQEYWWND